MPDVEAEIQLLEDAMRHHFLPAITGRQALSDAERELMALPVRLGGPRYINTNEDCSQPIQIVA